MTKELVKRKARIGFSFSAMEYVIITIVLGGLVYSAMLTARMRGQLGDLLATDVYLYTLVFASYVTWFTWQGVKKDTCKFLSWYIVFEMGFSFFLETGISPFGTFKPAEILFAGTLGFCPGFTFFLIYSVLLFFKKADK